MTFFSKNYFNEPVKLFDDTNILINSTLKDNIHGQGA